MRELSTSKLEKICNDYLNGNRGDMWKAIRGLNKLELANLLYRCDQFGVMRHLMYTQVQFALGSN